MIAALVALLGLFVLIVASTNHAGPASSEAPAAEACAGSMEADCSLHAGASRVGLHLLHGAGCHAASSACVPMILPSQPAFRAGAARKTPASPYAAAFWSDRVRDPILRPPIGRT